MEDTSLNKHPSTFKEMSVFEYVLHCEFYLYLISTLLLLSSPVSKVTKKKKHIFKFSHTQNANNPKVYFGSEFNK